MKRVLILVCALIVLCSATAYASFDDAYGTSVEFLLKLNILQSDDSVFSKSEDTALTRGEFAILAYRALGQKVTGNGSAYFYDVPATSPAYDAANMLAQLGVVNGNGNGMFNPDDNIELYDALAVMLRLMGYQNPQNLSNELFVTKICSSYDLLERNDFAQALSDKKSVLILFTKLLSAPVMDIDYIGYVPERVVDYSVYDDTLLSRYFDIYKTEGILVSNGIVDINGDKVHSDRIKVGDITVKSEGPVSLGAGSQVDLYYKGTDSKEFFAVYYDEINGFKTLDYSNLSGLYDGGYEYEENGKIKKLPVDAKNATYIYNNTLLTSSADKYMLPGYASISFTDNDGNGKYDVVDIKSYNSFLANNIFEEDGIYTISSTDGTTVYIDEEEPCIIKDGANVISPSELAAGSVVSCATIEKTVDGSVRLYAKEIVVSKARLTGSVDSIEYDGNTVHMVYVDGKEYLLYPFNTKLHSIIAPTDSNAEFCLDFMGNIVDMNYNSTLADVAVGYVIDVGPIDTGLDGERASFYIFDELERIKEYVCAEKVVIDGEVVKNPVYTDYTSLIGEVILFKVDEKDCISYIDTATEYSADMVTTNKNTLVKMGDSSNSENAGGLYYNSNCKAFDGSVNIDSYTMILSIPSDTENALESDYKLLNISNLSGGSRYTVEGYGTNPDSVICDILVIRAVPDVRANYDISVVTQVGTALNKDGIETYSLHLTDKTGNHVYTLKDPSLLNAFSDVGGEITNSTPKVKVQAGDLVRYKLDEASEIEQLVISYDRSNDDVKDRTNSTSRNLRYYYYYTVRTFSAVPYSINGDFLRIARAGGEPYTINDFEHIAFANIQNVFYVDMNRGKINVSKISPAAIKTIKANGTVDSKMIVNIISQSRVNIYIYDSEVQ